MQAEIQPEVWQRGPIEGIPSLLQPVAHAILQAEEEIKVVLNNIQPDRIWLQPAGVASVAFHIQHITGVLNRLFTYAKGETLTPGQLNILSSEGKENGNITSTKLLYDLRLQTEKCIEQLKITDEKTLTDNRGIGRRQIPTTVLGLLFHAAEHTMRHTGQLLVTAKIAQHTTAGNTL